MDSDYACTRRFKLWSSPALKLGILSNLYSIFIQLYTHYRELYLNYLIFSLYFYISEFYSFIFLTRITATLR